jgi:hypothetical protein
MVFNAPFTINKSTMVFQFHPTIHFILDPVPYRPHQNSRAAMRQFYLSCFVLTMLSGAALAQEREWQLDATDQDAFLVFGVPQSDDVGISFWCKLGSKRLKVMSPVVSMHLKQGATLPVILEIGGKDFALTGRSAVGAKGTEDTVEAETPAKGPLVDALEESDRFRVRVGGHQATFPLLDADIDGLLKLCRDVPTEAQQ